MTVQLKRIVNAAVWLDGTIFLGRVAEFTLPELKQVLQDVKALGLYGKRRLPAGLDTMEAKLKFNGIYAEAMKLTGNPFKAFNLQLRGHQEDWGPSGRTDEAAVVVDLTGNWVSVQLGTYKPQENVEVDATLDVHFLQASVAGETVLKVDLGAQMYQVGGEDLLEGFRSALGI
jgi:hypothetical protein